MARPFGKILVIASFILIWLTECIHPWAVGVNNFFQGTVGQSEPSPKKILTKERARIIIAKFRKEQRRSLALDARLRREFYKKGSRSNIP